MKSSALVALLALAVGAAALVLVIMRPSAPAPPSKQLPLPVAAEPEAGVLARVDALDEEHRALRERLASLELRAAPVAQRAPVTEGFVSREEFEAFRDEVLAALGRPRDDPAASAQPPTSAELQDFREHVATALTEIRKQEAVAKLASLEERTAELDASMPKIEAWLGLTRAQSERMRSVLLGQYEREADIVRRWQEGADPEVLGAMKRNDREVHRAELAEILTPEQLATYTSRR